jgi:hypothetical protein
MTREILPLAIVLVVIVTLWLLIRVSQWERKALWIVVPVMLAFAAYSWKAVDSLLGYATGDLSELSEPFTYIIHVGQEPVWLWAVPAGGSEPRAYVLTDLSEEEREGLTQAGARAAVGVPIEGTYSEGEFELHDLEGPIMRPKEG